VRRDPYFAGFCSIMVNVSDIAAMGGRPLAVVDVLFAGAEAETAELFRGMSVAADTFGVPVVGGHTSRLEETSVLAVAIVGRANALITSFDARPGQLVLVAVDLRGQFRDKEGSNFDAATRAAPADLRRLSTLPAELAEEGLIGAGKDISMAGLLGTLVMLLECSGCGAWIDLERVPIPKDTTLNRWLRAFPSYGYVFAVDPSRAPAVCDRFEAHGVACRAVGEVGESPLLTVESGDQSAIFWDFRGEGLTGFGPPKGGPRA
jgi:AIR synthase-related protein